MEVPLEASAPEAISDTPAEEALPDEGGGWITLHGAEQDVVVALHPDWVSLLSDGMLGEVVEADSDAAMDLMQEVASQGFGTVQSTLAEVGLELPSIRFEAVPPGEERSAFDGLAWRVAFSAQHEDSELEGVVLFPDGDDGSTSAEASSTDDTLEQQDDDPSLGSPKGTSQREASSEPSSEVDVAPAAFSELGEEDLGSNGDDASNFELLAEVNLEVRVELGRRELPLADVLKLTTGSVVELEKMVGEPLSVYANGRLIAEGEAVVIDEQFGVRITNLASESHREKAFF